MFFFLSSGVSSPKLYHLQLPTSLCHQAAKGVSSPLPMSDTNFPKSIHSCTLTPKARLSFQLDEEQIAGFPPLFFLCFNLPGDETSTAKGRQDFVFMEFTYLFIYYFCGKSMLPISSTYWLLTREGAWEVDHGGSRSLPVDNIIRQPEIERRPLTWNWRWSFISIASAGRRFNKTPLCRSSDQVGLLTAQRCLSIHQDWWVPLTSSTLYFSIRGTIKSWLEFIRLQSLALQTPVP